MATHPIDSPAQSPREHLRDAIAGLQSIPERTVAEEQALGKAKSALVMLEIDSGKKPKER